MLPGPQWFEPLVDGSGMGPLSQDFRLLMILVPQVKDVWCHGVEVSVLNSKDEIMKPTERAFFGIITFKFNVMCWLDHLELFMLDAINSPTEILHHESIWIQSRDQINT